jgi:hypothetical protein
MTITASPFDRYRAEAWPHQFHGELIVRNLAGTTPSDPKVTEGWLRTKFQDDDDLIRKMVMETAVERGISVEEAIDEVDRLKHLNGFKRDEQGLYYEGRQLKAMLKEASMIAANAGKISTKGWGNPDNGNFKKGLKGWFPEHVFVLEDRLYLGRKQADGVEQRFIHGRYGSAIQYEETIHETTLSFTIISDFAFTEKQWAMIWLTGEQEGIGGSRPQGCGRFTMTVWEPTVVDWPWAAEQLRKHVAEGDALGEDET